MAFPASALILSYLLAISTTDQLSLNVTAVQKLVDVGYAMGNGELLPGMRYNNSINIAWAVKGASLRGLDGQVVSVKVTATANNSSDIQFASPFGLPQTSAEAYLQCAVSNGTCLNISNLTAQIPFTISVKEGGNTVAAISIKSEISQQAALPDADEVQKTAAGLFDSLKNALTQNGTGAKQSEGGPQPGERKNASQHANATNNSGNGNFLDSLKPEGDSKNPIEFLRSNPLISIAALGIVIIITGAYLINAKD